MKQTHIKQLMCNKYFDENFSMSIEDFYITQVHFGLAVKNWRKILVQLLSRFEREDMGSEDNVKDHCLFVLADNLYDETGGAVMNNSHIKTFDQFLKFVLTLDKNIDHHEIITQQSAKHAYDLIELFNQSINLQTTSKDWVFIFAMLGTIECLYQSVSAYIYKYVKSKTNVKDLKENEHKQIPHYELHANLDTEHAEAFFQVLNMHASDKKNDEKIISGMHHGYDTMNNLYTSLSNCTRERQRF